MCIRVINLGCDTSGNPNFSKSLTKLAILPDYKCPRKLRLALPPCFKVQKLDFQSVKNNPNLSEFFFIEDDFLMTSNLEKTLLLKLGQIFDEVAKLSKST